MNTVRKWMALVLACMLLTSLTACGGGESTESGAPQSSAAESESVESSTTTTTTTTTASDTSSGGTTTRSKVNVMTSSKASTTTTTASKPTVPKKPLGMTVGGIKTVICWGDSITEGLAMGDGDRYPDVLQEYLGSSYNVLNAGSSGDSSYAVMARQGALKLTTKKDIHFDAGVSEVKIGHSKETFCLMLDNGMELQGLNVQADITSTNAKKLRFNPLTIGGAKYTMGYSLKGQKPDSGYNIMLSRENAAAALTIPAGTAVTMASADKSDTSYCEIIHMGANDKISTEPVSALVSRYQTMIDRMPHEAYMVIVPYWAPGRYERAFKEAFGDKAINFVEEIEKRGLSELGLTMTAEDQEKLEKNQVPVSLQYKTKDGCHLNEYGYKLLATVVYERGKQLGYWK